MKKIAILAHRDVAVFELACATELFALSRPEFDDWYTAQVVSLSPGPFECTGGVQLSCVEMADLNTFDTLIIPSWPVTQKRIPQTIAKPILDFANRDGQLLSFCSGAFLLGYLGLLDDRDATTHWRYQSQFEQAFPSSRYQANILYTLDEHVGCSAGSAAAIDLGLAVIRRDFGNDIANSVARRLVLNGHRKGGQAQFVETPISHQSDRLGDTMQWASANLSASISINTLAQRASMSRRSFDRIFRAQIGLSPQQWLLTQRISLACRLLETGNSTIEHVAAHSGFSSAASLRHHFKRQLALSPRQFRDNFRR